MPPKDGFNMEDFLRNALETNQSIDQKCKNDCVSNAGDLDGDEDIVDIFGLKETITQEGSD